jgi:hypothetical protein
MKIRTARSRAMIPMTSITCGHEVIGFSCGCPAELVDIALPIERRASVQRLARDENAAISRLTAQYVRMEKIVMKKPAFTFLAILVSVTACDPYSPGQRAVGGGVLGAGAGAAVGGLAGGHAGTGAAIGGGLGAIGGAATTPERPTYQSY